MPNVEYNLDTIKEIRNSINSILENHKGNTDKTATELTKFCLDLLDKQKAACANDIKNRYDTQFRPNFKMLILDIEKIVLTSEIKNKQWKTA